MHAAFLAGIQAEIRIVTRLTAAAPVRAETDTASSIGTPLVDMEPNAAYVTINLGEIYITDNIREKSFGLDGYLGEILSRLREVCEE